MGRTQTFDTADVVRAARHVFWEHGYDASLPAIEDATGVGRSSLYHAFGSKRGLYDAAVQNYLDEVVRPRLEPLLADPVHPDAVVDYFASLRAALGDQGALPADCGCLLLDAAGAPIGRDDAVREVVASYQQDLQRAMARGIAARAPGLPDDERDRLATVCVSLVVTALTLARIDRTQAARTLDIALELLSGERSAA